MIDEYDCGNVTAPFTTVCDGMTEPSATIATVNPLRWFNPPTVVVGTDIDHAQRALVDEIGRIGLPAGNARKLQLAARAFDSHGRYARVASDYAWDIRFAPAGATAEATTCSRA